MNETLKLLASMPLILRLYLLALSLCAIVTSLVEVGLVFYSREFFDIFFGDTLLISTGIQKSFIFGIIALCAGVIRYYLVIIQYKVASQLGIGISRLAYDSILSRSYRELRSLRYSRCISLLGNDLPRTQEALTNMAILATSSILLLVMSAGLLVLDPLAVLIISCTLILIGVSTYFPRAKFVRKNGERMIRCKNSIIHIVDSSLNGITQLLANGSLNRKIKHFNSAQRVSQKSLAGLYIYTQTPRYVIEASVFSLLSLLTVLVLLSNGDKSYLLSTCGSMIIGLNRILPSLQQGYSSYAFVKSSNTSVKAIRKEIEHNKHRLFNEESILELTKKQKTAPPQHNEIEEILIDNISINTLDKTIYYPNHTFKKGQPTCLSGPSGSGKSSLFELLLGFTKQSSGSIKVISNTCISSVNDSILTNVFYLDQKPVLYTGTIRHNLKSMINSRHEFDSLDNIKILSMYSRMLGLESEFGSINKFLNTSLVENGRNISGGQAQRIWLLASLITQKRILILDEPTSALSETTAMEYINLLLKTTSNKIVIVSSHDEKIKNRIDNILSLV